MKKRTFSTLKSGISARLFVLLSMHRFKKLDFSAMIYSPLRIEGSEYISIHRNVRIKKFAWLFAAKIDDFEPELIINEGCGIGDFSHISAVRKVIFGKNVLTGNGVLISDNMHSYEDINVPIIDQKIKFKGEVIIGDGAWIGENACVIGAKVGKNSVIGANSVVTKDVPDYSVAAGIPARVIRRYNCHTGLWEVTEG